MILRVAYAGQNRFRRDQALVHFQIFGRSLHDLKLIGFIVDREVSRVIQGLDLAAQNAYAERVKGRDQWVAGSRGAKQVFDAELHVVGGLVGERDRQDVLRTNISHFDQVSHAVRDHSRLAAPGPGKNKDGTFGCLNSLELLRIEKLR